MKQLFLRSTFIYVRPATRSLDKSLFQIIGVSVTLTTVLLHVLHGSQNFSNYLVRGSVMVFFSITTSTDFLESCFEQFLWLSCNIGLPFKLGTSTSLWLRISAQLCFSYMMRSTLSFNYVN